MLNLERKDILLFYYTAYLKANLDLKNKSAWWIFTQLYFRSSVSWPNCYRKKSELMENFDLTISLKRWKEVKTWGGYRFKGLDALWHMH